MSKHAPGQTLAGLAALIVAITIATRARAQSETPPSEPATIDTARGPITGSTRQIGLGGAFVAIADDSEGVAINPAATAVRLPYSWHPWDYGVGVDVSVGAWLPKNDIYNQPDSGNVSKSTALVGSAAGVLYYQHAGIGASAEAQSNAATRQDQAQGFAPTDLSANFGMVHASLAYGFLDGQLLLGAGPRFVGMSFDRNNSGSGPLSATGVGSELGIVVKPIVAQWRVAAAVKSAITANVPGEPGSPSSKVHVPWEAAFGFAYQFGPRALNPAFVTDKQLARSLARGQEPSDVDVQKAGSLLYSRYLERQRWYLLVSTELSLSERGGSQIFDGEDATEADQPVISPRLGVESEVVPHVLKLRVGSYYEPARASGARARIHGTGGFDVRLFEWSIFGLIREFDWWQLSVAADGARSYLNTSFSIGFWH
jgi:hypothetical protein